MLKHLLRISIFVAIAWATICVSHVASAAEWGSIKGRILVDGAAPKPAPLLVNKDQHCIDSKPVNEIIVTGKDNALVNAVVYLRLGTGQKTEVHPDYEAKLKEPVVLDNKNCAFVPHITLARVGQTLTIKNSDPPPVGHNTNIPALSFNQTVPSQGEVKLTLPKPGQPLPTPVVCSIHTWMKGYLLSLDHPYMAVAGNDGTFEIKNVPAGPHEFQFWHEAAGYLKNLKLKGGATDARGRAKLTIPAGGTLDVGDVKVPASALKIN